MRFWNRDRLRTYVHRSNVTTLVYCSCSIFFAFATAVIKLIETSLIHFQLSTNGAHPSGQPTCPPRLVKSRNRLPEPVAVRLLGCMSPSLAATDRHVTSGSSRAWTTQKGIATSCLLKTTSECDLVSRHTVATFQSYGKQGRTYMRRVNGRLSPVYSSDGKGTSPRALISE